MPAVHPAVHRPYTRGTPSVHCIPPCIPWYTGCTPSVHWLYTCCTPTDSCNIPYSLTNYIYITVNPAPGRLSVTDLPYTVGYRSRHRQLWPAVHHRQLHLRTPKELGMLSTELHATVRTLLPVVQLWPFRPYVACNPYPWPPNVLTRGVPMRLCTGHRVVDQRQLCPI